MSHYTGPKNRLSRRFGVELFGRRDEKSKRGEAIKKNYPPGQHGQNKLSKPSEFAKHLMEKQRLRFLFSITEKQLRRYYQMASKSKGVTGDELLTLLERRLDNVIFRAGLAKTRAQARQIVSHSLINLNGKKVDIPSIQVKVGDLFEVRKAVKSSPLFEEIRKMKVTLPKWLEVDFKNLTGKIKSLPEKEDFEKIVNPQLVVEYYSK
ncbi:30S ribosomal protein S4 [Candidatus Peregrinibacteria bacterium]|nr:30S ribosomal protein S4 [Candidatus Peregrinibacteria bacterium]